MELGQRIGWTMGENAGFPIYDEAINVRDNIALDEV